MYSKAKHRGRRTLIPYITIVVLVVILFVIIAAARSFHPSTLNDFSDYKYDGEIAVTINDNCSNFTDKEKKRARKGAFEDYSKLDKLGRCGAATANICKETMPGDDEKRESIGSINPSGWQSINFWSRCHLIGWQLSGENDNERNLITGTSRMNLSGMLPRENQIATYIRDNPNNHVLLKVDPIYEGTDLVASGVHMQAWSVEDKGKGIDFNYYIFNYQPGYIIDYSNGTVSPDPDHQTYISLSDKTSLYTGEPITIDDATVEGSTADIKYIYYLDEEMNNKTTELDGAEYSGSAPSKSGTYYVKAVISGDNWYPSAASNTAKLVIR